MPRPTVSVDHLSVKIGADASKANGALDILIRDIGDLSKAISSMDMSKITSQMAAFGKTLKTIDAKPLAKNVNNLATATSKYVTSVNKMNAATKSSGTVFSSLSSGISNVYGTLSRINSKINDFTFKMRSANKETKNFAQTVGLLYARFFLLIRGIKTLSNQVKSSMDYIEVLNYFDSSMGQVAERGVSQWEEMGYDSADAYYNSFSQRAREVTRDMSGFFPESDGSLTATNMASLGMNPQQLLQYQAQYAQMASSMGNTSEQALKLSEVMTKLGADLASVKNLDFNETWGNLASGLVGMSRTMDRFGVNIRAANMEMKLHELGIDATVNSLSQADKALLRTIIILDSTRYAWADLSETLNTPANQFRMLTNNVKLLGQMIGGILLPVVAKILPYLNAFVIVLQRLFSWLARILGIDLSGLMAKNDTPDNSALSDVLDDAEGLGDALEEDASNAKKLKKQLQGFDALNNLTTKEDTSKLDPLAVSGLLDNAFNDAVDEYLKAWEDAFKKLENAAQELADKIQAFFLKLFDPIVKGWQSAGYRVINGFRNAFESLKKLAKSVGDSFWEVWGQKRTSKIFQNLFIALGDILDTIGIIGDKIREAWDYGKTGTKILESIRDGFYYVSIYVERMAENTKKWAKDLNLKPIIGKMQTYLEGLAPIISVIAGTISDFYNDVLLKLAKWTLEKGLPDLVQVFIDFNNDVKWVELRNKLKDLWDAIEKFGETVGQGIILFVDKLTDAISKFVNGKGQDFIDWFANFLRNVKPEQIEKLIERVIKAFIGLKLALVGFTGLSGIANIVATFDKLKPALAGIAGLFTDLGTKISAIIPTVKTFMKLPLWGKKLALTTGVKGLITSFKTLLKTMNPVKKMFLSIITVIEEFKIVNKAVYELTTGTDKIGANIAKIIASVAGAGVILGGMFGWVGVAVAGVVAAISALDAFEKGMKKVAQTVEQTNFEGIMQTVFAPNGGTAVTDIMQGFADQIADIGDGFARISNASEGFVSAKENIATTANSIDLIKIKMDNGVLSVEEGVAQLETHFENLRQITEDKFTSIENTLISAFGENGALHEALGQIGVDSTEIVSELTSMNKDVMEEIESLREQMKEVEQGSDEYNRLSERIQYLTGATDETTEATKKFNEQMSRLEDADWSGLFDDGQINMAKFNAALDDVSNSMDNTISQMEDSKKKLEDVLYEELDVAVKSGDTAAQAKIEGYLNAINQAYDNMELEVVNRGQKLTNQLQTYLVENVGNVIDQAKAEYEEMDFKTKMNLAFDGIQNADAYAKSMAEKYNTEIVQPTAETIENSFTELGIQGAGWASDAMSYIFENGFGRAFDVNSISIGLQTSMNDNIHQIITDSMDGLGVVAYDKGKEIGANIPEGLNVGINDASQKKQYFTSNRMLMSEGYEEARKEIKSHSPSKLYAELGTFIVMGLEQGINSRTGNAVSTMSQLMTKMTVPFNNSRNALTVVGSNLMIGLANGINSAAGPLISRAISIANSITNIFRSVWQIHSPSRVMDDMGVYFMQGFQNGIESMYQPIEKSVNGFGTELAKSPDIANEMSNIQGNVANVSANSSQTFNADSSETNALLREQNGLLQAILEKDMGISEGALFKSVQNSATSYYKMTGNKAFA